MVNSGPMLVASWSQHAAVRAMQASSVGAAVTNLGRCGQMGCPRETGVWIYCRMGCHNLPRDMGSRTAVPRSQRLCTVCQVGQPGDEYHQVFECQGLHHIRDKYPGLFEQRTMVQFMWQADLHGVAKCHMIVWAYIMTLTPEGVRHLISPR